jgi:hypothetical protein
MAGTDPAEQGQPIHPVMLWRPIVLVAGLVLLEGGA